MNEFRFAIKSTIPIFFTYLFIGIAFGVLMSDAGYSVLLSTLSAVFIYAGSMQLIMVPMMTAHASLPAPFLLFGHKQLPKSIQYLGTVLPPAIMTILVLYCIRNIDLSNRPYGLPEIISCVMVAVLQIFKNNMYLSIISGTLCYMMLIRLI